MGECLILTEGSAVRSDECTARREHVLQGHTAITADSDDEPAEGTMASIGSLSVNLKCGESKTFPAGYTTGGTVSSNSLSSQTEGTLEAKKMVSGTDGYSNGKLIKGTMVDRGPYAYASGIGEGADDSSSGYYAFNNMPEGWYHETESTKSWSPEIRLPRDTVRKYMGITADKIRRGQSVAGIAGTGVQKVHSMGDICFYGFNGSGSDGTGPVEYSFTLPSKGMVYYSGGSASYSARGTAIAEIYREGELMASRNIDDSERRYVVRSTMINQSFSVEAGETVKIRISAQPGTHVIAFMFATIVYD